MQFQVTITYGQYFVFATNFDTKHLLSSSVELLDVMVFSLPSVELRKHHRCPSWKSPGGQNVLSPRAFGFHHFFLGRCSAVFLFFLRISMCGCVAERDIASRSKRKPVPQPREKRTKNDFMIWPNKKAARNRKETGSIQLCSTTRNKKLPSWGFSRRKVTFFIFTSVYWRLSFTL